MKSCRVDAHASRELSDADDLNKTRTSFIPAGYPQYNNVSDKNGDKYFLRFGWVHAECKQDRFRCSLVHVPTQHKQIMYNCGHPKISLNLIWRD